MQLVAPLSHCDTYSAEVVSKEIMGCTYQDCEYTHNHVTSYNIMLASSY